MVSSLDNRVLFGMKATAKFMAFSRRDALFLTEAADIQTVFQSGRSPIITRRQNLFIFDEESTHPPSEAGGAFGDEMGDIHEIFFPRGPTKMNLSLPVVRYRYDSVGTTIVPIRSDSSRLFLFQG
jgi:hypothetical protein